MRGLSENAYPVIGAQTVSAPKGFLIRVNRGEWLKSVTVKAGDVIEVRQEDAAR